MNELPKSVRDRLGSQRPATAHPDADLLAAFTEGTLSQPERQQVLEHVSTCAECREVVFLAGPTETPQQVVLVPARARILRWLTPVAAVAVVAVGVGLYVELRSSGNTPVEAPKPVLTASTTKPQEEVRSEVEAPPQAALPRRAEVPRANKKSEPTMLNPRERRQEDDERNAGAVGGNLTAPAVAPAPMQPPAAIVSAAPVQADHAAAPGVAVPESKDEISQKASPVMAAKARPTSSPESKQDATRSETTVEVSSSSGLVNSNSGFAPSQRMAKTLDLRPHWRISNTGGLERSYTTGEWQPVLKKAKTEFRVVAVIGSHIWAGGANGELYHSRNDGDTWKKIEVTSSGQRPTSAISSIRFDDEQHGTVTTMTGEAWITADQGKTWKKQ